MISGWDEYYLGMAKYISRKGTCPAKRVGSIIVTSDENSPISMGYNGSPRGTAHCGEACEKRQIGENSKSCRAVHAELNAILNAGFNGVSVRGARLYVTISPCLSCARAIIQSGIVEVVSAGKSPYDRALDLLSEAGVSMRIIKPLGYPKMKLELDV